VGKIGDQLPGPGGFTDIAAGTRKVTFCSTMTGGGLEVRAEDGKLEILREGSIRRFVRDVGMVCFSGRRAVELGHEIRYLTERATFRLTAEGLLLEEIAPGIDCRSQVLDQSDFEIHVSPDLKLMDERLFRPEPMFLGLNP
jgi:propionate CoA-transferase